ncbi:MAG: YHS domain-containing protein [Dehalococcoidia bacterium]|nr:YHS domain-containing protein [Dehalococcoidia bacterium]
MVIDPVCGTEVNEASTPREEWQYWGVPFYFCSSKCREAFQREPEKYVEVESDEELSYDPRMFLGDM